VSWTQTELDALDAAIAQGVLSYTINGKTVTYRSLDDMLRLRAQMQREIGLSTTQSAKRVTYLSFKRD
jgi:hypothetical protein